MKSLTYIVTGIFTILLILGCQHNSQKPTLIVAKDKIGLIGYGSLTSKENLNRILDHPYKDSLFYVHLNGYVREWNFAGSNTDPHLPEELLKYDSFYLRNGDTIPFQKTIFLNIMPNSSYSINGVLYFVNQKELISIDHMELGYERIDVTEHIEEYTIQGGTIYAYRAKPDYIFRPEIDTETAIIEQEYADLVHEAYLTLGTDAKKEFDASTKPYQKNQVARVIRVKVRD